MFDYIKKKYSEFQERQTVLRAEAAVAEKKRLTQFRRNYFVIETDDNNGKTQYEHRTNVLNSIYDTATANHTSVNAYIFRNDGTPVKAFKIDRSINMGSFGPGGFTANPYPPDRRPKYIEYYDWKNADYS
jgi:hypothetical protein